MKSGYTDIGTKLKSLRLSHHLTLEELANRSELSKGFLSQVERNLTSPAVDSLEDILEALGVTLHDFFDEQEPETLVFDEEDFFVNEQDDYVINYIVPNAQKNDMEPILIHLPAKKCSMKIEPHGGEEFGYVLTGKVCLHFGAREEVVKTGQTFYLKGTRTHYLENKWQRDAGVIWIMTPPNF